MQVVVVNEVTWLVSTFSVKWDALSPWNASLGNEPLPIVVLKLASGNDKKL
jgi:hypothetical protein